VDASPTLSGSVSDVDCSNGDSGVIVYGKLAGIIVGNILLIATAAKDLLRCGTAERSAAEICRYAR
jgi:hypothetical protein